MAPGRRTTRCGDLRLLIGYAATIRVPPIWIGLGIRLSLLNRWLFPDEGPHSLDILISLALTRSRCHCSTDCTLPLPCCSCPPSPCWPLLTEPVNAFLEYGTEVPTRFARRRCATRWTAWPGGGALGDCSGCVSGPRIRAIRHFEGHRVHGGRMSDFAGCDDDDTRQLPHRADPGSGPLIPLIRWTGRNTLWVYAAHLVILQVVSKSINGCVVEED